MSRLRKLLTPGAFMRAVAVLVGGTAVGQVVVLGASPILSRLFDPESFGLLAVYTAILSVAVSAGSLRLEQAIGLPKSEQEAYNVFVLAALSASSVAVVVWLLGLFAPGILFASAGEETPSWMAWLVPVGILFGSIYQAMSVWALRERAFKSLAATKVSQSVGATAIQLAAGFLGAGPIGLVGGHAAGQSIGSGSLFHSTMRRRNLRLPTRGELGTSLKRFRRFPLLATPAALLNSLSLQIPVFILTPAVGVALMGQYFMAYRMTFAPLDLLGRSIGQVFYSEAITLGAEQPRKLRRLVAVTSLKSFLIGLVPGLAILLLSPIVFPLIFGGEWQEAGYMSQALAVMLMANFAISPVSQIFLIVEKQFFSVIVNAAKILVSASSLLIPINLGLSAVMIVLVYSCAMALYYLGVLVTALLLLSVMKARNEED